MVSLAFTSRYGHQMRWQFQSLEISITGFAMRIQCTSVTRIWESGNASYRGSKLVLCISMQSTHVTTTMQLRKPTHMASLLNYAPWPPVLSPTYINTSGKTRPGCKSVLNVNRWTRLFLSMRCISAPGGTFLSDTLKGILRNIVS